MNRKSRNVPKKKLQAVKLVAADELPDEQIASKCGIDRRTLTRWKGQKDFAASVAQFKAKRANGAGKAVEEEAFVTVKRLIELAMMAPEDTNGTINGQVRACMGIAEIRQELIKLHGDVTDRLRNKSVNELEFIAIHRRDPRSPQELAEFVKSRKLQN